MPIVTERAAAAAAALVKLGAVKGSFASISAGERVTATDALSVLRTVGSLGLGVPEALTDELEQAVEMYRRLGTLTTRRSVYTADDLAAKDYVKRFNDTAIVQLLADRGPKLLEPLREELDARTRGTLRRYAQKLIGLLNTVWPAHAAVEVETPGPILAAHKTLLSWQPATRQPTYAGGWCMHWSWKQPGSWNRLVETSGAYMTVPEGMVYQVATQCGGVPELTPSRQDAEDRATKHQQAWEIWRADQAAKGETAQAGRAWEQALAEAQREAEADRKRAETLAELRAMNAG